MFRQKVVSALILIPIVLAVTYAGVWPFFSLVFLVSVLALRELYRLGGLRARPLLVLGHLANFVMLLVLPVFGLGTFFALFVAFFLLLNVFWVLSFPLDFRSLTILLWGKVYITTLLGFLLLLRLPPGGFLPVLTLLLAVWVSDAGAFLTGRYWGKRRLLVTVSPKKTWAGAFGGLFFTALLLFSLAPQLGFSRPSGLLIGLLLSLAGQCGDLAESALKRWAQIKDSGTLLPGHGGILDRLDSLLFAAPVAYLLLSFMTGARSPW